MRVLLAKHRATQQWFQRLDSGASKTLADFRAEVARQFRVAEAMVVDEVRTLNPEEYAAVKTALGTGRFEGAEVIPATANIGPDPRGFLAAVIGALNGPTQTAKLQRAQDQREKAPGITEAFLETLTGPRMSATQTTVLQIIWARVRARVGTPTEIADAGEVARIEAAAASYGIALQ